MTTDRKHEETDARRLVLRFERARDEDPISESDARGFIGDLGIDADAEFMRMLDSIGPTPADINVDVPAMLDPTAECIDWSLPCRLEVNRG